MISKAGGTPGGGTLGRTTPEVVGAGPMLRWPTLEGHATRTPSWRSLLEVRRGAAREVALWWSHPAWPCTRAQSAGGHYHPVISAPSEQLQESVCSAGGR